MLEIIFWILLGLIIYTYLGYPVLLSLISLFIKKPIKKSSKYLPTVSLIITAYNEEKSIKKKIENSLSLDYPKEKIEIIIASDGSTDKTNQIIKKYKQIRFLDLKRMGKNNALNQTFKIANNEILVFSDANSILKKDAIKRLIRNFYDSKVGGVCGKLKYINPVNNLNKADHLYWKYENFLKDKESKINSLVTVNGSFFAIRKKIFKKLFPDSAADLELPFEIFEQNLRTIFEPSAITFEEINSDMKKEFYRKRRTTSRTLRSIFLFKKYLNPFKYKFFSIQLISHKLLRFFVPIFLIGIFITNLTLINLFLYQIMLYLQLVFYTLALFAPIKKTKAKLFSIPFYFCFVNIILFISLIRAIIGEKIITWNTQR